MKKISMLFLAGLLSFPAFSQDKGIKQYGFWDNWYLQLQGGGTYTFSENSSDAKFMKILTPHAAISLGKNFSPYAGTRVQFGGWLAKSYNQPKNDYYHVTYFQANLDGMFNLTNILCSFKENRTFNLYGILGAGFFHSFPKQTNGIIKNNYIVPRAGFQADFRTSEVVSINLEVVGNLLPDRFNGRVEGSKYDGTLDAMLGLTFRFPQRGFKVITASDPDAIKRLNDKINDYQSKNKDLQSQLDDKDKTIADLQNQLSKKPTEKIIKEAGSKETVLNALVVFKLGSAALEDNQEINIYNAAKYLRENPNVKVIVTGYADKKTGNTAINQKLSEKRAQAVADILTQKYGIDSSRIQTKASGDSEQPFEINEWNRVVIFTAK